MIEELLLNNYSCGAPPTGEAVVSLAHGQVGLNGFFVKLPEIGQYLFLSGDPTDYFEGKFFKLSNLIFSYVSQKNGVVVFDFGAGTYFCSRVSLGSVDKEFNRIWITSDVPPYGVEKPIYVELNSSGEMNFFDNSSRVSEELPLTSGEIRELLSIWDK